MTLDITLWELVIITLVIYLVGVGLGWFLKGWIR